MDKRGKRAVASLMGVLIGAALVAVGVWVWVDGNTGFGAVAIVIGAVIWFGVLGGAADRRRKAKRQA